VSTELGAPPPSLWFTGADAVRRGAGDGRLVGGPTRLDRDPAYTLAALLDTEA